MANSVLFNINDTSPTILYEPFADTLSIPDLSAGWNPYYTLSGFATVPGEVGNGTSLHITSKNGSSLSVQWNGTGIRLLGNATSASYSITLDGAPFTPPASSDNNLLAAITNLSDTSHTVVLTALIPTSQNPPDSSMLVFESALLTSSPEPINVSFSSQTIDDNVIAFLGRWSFDTASTGASFHISQTLGDRLIAPFNGTTFLLQGVTSPNSGNYTVTVDNVTTILSAQSSFTSFDSLLYYATGLDPGVPHMVEVSNSGGGDLSLLVGGFTAFVPFNTLPPPQTSSTSALSNGSFPKGTIAALVLGGVLASLIFSGLIFYFFFYRPRKRRRLALAAQRQRSPKEHEAGVLDIGPMAPEVDKPAESDYPIDMDPRNVRNGLSYWIRGAVDGNPGEASLPLRFRHSDSLDEKLNSPSNEAPLDDASDVSATSSIIRKAKAKSKGKARQIIGRSWSPARILDIPSRRPTGRSSTRRLSHQAESLGYVSTFMAADPISPQNIAPPPPSYAASVSNRDSKSTTNGKHNSGHSSDRSVPSVPHSVSPFPGDEPSYPLLKQDNTGAFLLPREESQLERDSSVGSSFHLLKPPQSIPMRSLTRVDQGTAAENNVDGAIPASFQHAVRGPRAIRHPYANQDDDSSQASPSPQATNFMKDPVPTNDDDLVEVRDGVFLSVTPPSPFKLVFDKIRTRSGISNTTNSGVLSYMSTLSPSKQHEHSPGGFESEPTPNPNDYTRSMPTSPDFVQGPSNMQFQMAPLSISPTSPIPASKSGSEGVTSFLDFSSSREGSLASRSLKTTSWAEERHRDSLFVPPIEEKSRWSNTTVPSMQSKSASHGNSHNSGSGNGSSESSKKRHSLPPSAFSMPVRLSIPSSPYNAGSARPTSGITQAAENLHIHPPFENLESPSESAPVSPSGVSELHFRQSVSEENIGSNSRRTTESSLVFVSSHPPLPTRHDDFTPRPFDPSILVNRVLGIPHPTSTTTTRISTSGRPSSTPISGPRPFASSPNLLTSQHVPNSYPRSRTDP